MTKVTDDRQFVQLNVAADILGVEITDIRAMIQDGRLDVFNTQSGEVVPRIQIRCIADGGINFTT